MSKGQSLINGVNILADGLLADGGVAAADPGDRQLGVGVGVELWPGFAVYPHPHVQLVFDDSVIQWGGIPPELHLRYLGGVPAHGVIVPQWDGR